MKEQHDQSPPKINHIAYWVLVVVVFLIVVFISLLYTYKGLVTNARIKKDTGTSYSLEVIRQYEAERLQGIEAAKEKVVKKYNK